MKRTGCSASFQKALTAMSLGLAKAFWVIMLVGHLPALWSAGGNLSADLTNGLFLFKFVFIFASVVYFILKLAGYSFWSIQPSWQRMLVYCLIILLLHSGVIPAPDTGVSGWQCLHMATQVILAGGIAGIAFAILQLLNNHLAFAHGMILPDAHRGWQPFEEALAPLRAVLLASSLSRRGPPSRLLP